ncbi:ferredoxin [Chitinispirillales bacterium ANBcel5]|uniref:ferredoxin n=1 Tax=Cellulosispirillum alkaliphilum TaxID=3039283 RepID=UPI002A53DB45|nr:ferredoxin [Chitinispirillales bacterium ANBcel5]
MRVYVDIDSCEGCGMCVSLCEEVFCLAPDGRAGSKMFNVPQDSEGDCFLAVQFCPRHCIRIRDIRKSKGNGIQNFEL